MSFIEHMMQVCERVLAKAEQQKATTPGPKDATPQPSHHQISSTKKVN